jgi:tetratricopeptide (TPR) repeat protein
MAKRLMSAALLVSVLFSGVSHAQRAQVASEQEQWILGEYWTVVKDYDKGKTVDAIKEMAKWPQDRIAKVQATQFQPEAALNDLQMSKTEWRPALLRAAAMLHTEVGLDALKRQRSFPVFQFHAGIADGWFQLADNKRTIPGGLRSRWNVTVARVFLINKEFGAAEAFLERLNTKIANDAGVLLAFGTAKESRAARLIAGGAAAGGTGPGEKALDPAEVQRQAGELRSAAAAVFERAVAIDATLIEARLRLARIAIDRGDGANAEKELAAIKQAATTPGHQYLATLWLGQVRERQNPWTEAAELFVEAIKLQPDAESAYVALAGVLKANGEPAQSAGVMERFKSRNVTSPIADPLATYPLGFDTLLEARFAALIAESKTVK